jgi:Zn finger protein HypA/HybF involved in hydrogenase expression
MPLVASCDCGNQIKAKRELAGKKVKCPSCGDALRLPHPKANASPKQTADPLSDLLDEIGYENIGAKNSCPECKTKLPPDAVLCVQCGFHLQKGKRLSTKRITRGS